MHLLLDLGNTNAKVAIISPDGEKQRLEKVPTAAILKVVSHLLQEFPHLNAAAISSVSAPQPELNALLEDRFSHIVNLDHTTPVPITKQYATPATLGNDRLAAVVGAHARFPKAPVLVIDAGTCITYDIVTAEGNYLGGSISPGIHLRFQSLHTFTARLPLLGLQEGGDLIGNSTDSAIRSGVQEGATAEMQGIIRNYKERFKGLQVIITGGDADFFVRALKSSIFADSNLVVSGLNVILNHYVSQLAK